MKGILQQTLLATFLASGEKLVTVDALIEELWGATPPAKTGNALHAQISRLRRTLALLEPEQTDSRLATTAAGYQLSLHGATFDAATLLDTVRTIQAKGENVTMRDVATLRAALELWRGPIFGGITGGPICQMAKANYQEYQTVARLLLFEIELESGEHTKVVPELSRLVAEFPHRESFSALLMVALYRSGRQTDALSVARRLRSRLIEEMGIEPSPTLRGLEEAILNHDRQLLWPAGAAARPQPGRPLSGLVAQDQGVRRLELSRTLTMDGVSR